MSGTAPADDRPLHNRGLSGDRGVWPARGPISGGTTVTITGTNLTGASAVTFGGVAGTSITVVNQTMVSVVAPAMPAGAVDVVLTTPGGSVTSVEAYTFVDVPTIMSVRTNTGFSSGPVAGGMLVTITGTNLTDTSAVKFGGVEATSITNVSSTCVTVVTPSHSEGAADVVLTTPGGSVTVINAYTFVAASTITEVMPSCGPVAGGALVTITGTNLTGALAVTFGGTAGTSMSVVSATSVTVVTPAHVANPADVVLITPAGGTVTSAEAYSFVAAPTVTGIAPSSGPVAGGALVTIAGTNLSGTSSVTFGGAAGSSITVVSATSLTVVTPATTAGALDVVLTAPGGSVTSVGMYTFVAAPTIAGMPLVVSGESGGNAKVSTKSNSFERTRDSNGALLAHNSVASPPSEKSAAPTIGGMPLVVAGEEGGNARVSTEPISFGRTPHSDGVLMMHDTVASPPSEKFAVPTVAMTQLVIATKDDVVANAPIEPKFFELEPPRESVDLARDTIARRARKSVAIVIGLLLLVAAIDGFAVSIVTRQANRLESIHHELLAANEQVLVNAVASDLAIRSFLLSGDRSYVSDFELARPLLVESIAEFERVADKIGDQGLSQLVSSSSSIVTIWLRTFVDRTMMVASADMPRGDQLAGAELINNLRRTNTSIATYIDEVNDRAVATAGRVRRQTIFLAALVLLIAFLVIVVLIVKEVSDISYPLISTSRIVNRIYHGDSRARADDSLGPAETRAVARAVNELAFQQETAHEWVNQFNLAKTNFLNTVNHELRTPLTSITGFSELLGEEDMLSADERNHMAIVINRNAFRLNDLIDNMLTVLRIDAMEVRFKMSTFDIRGVINESVETFRTLAESRELSIVSDLGDTALLVRADSNEMLRVISNLVSNAVKFSIPGGRIEVSAKQTTSAEGKGEVAFSVKDSGIGIVDAELPHVGSRFYRASNAIAAAIPGTGLGLMIVSFIVKEHGGSWSLTSSQSVGTTVEVRLPMSGVIDV